jgi:hypothetical protein
MPAVRMPAVRWTSRRATSLLPTLGVAVLLACSPGEPAAGADNGAENGAGDAGAPELVAASPQEEFWAAMSAPCGQAFAGELVVDRPDVDMIAGDEELIGHWVECQDDRIHIAFHLGRDHGEGEWDRSRTWVLTRDDDGLELRHDHREPDGTEEEDTGYGGRTVDGGSADAQWFLFEERRAPDGSALGWRLEIVPGERYTYGTIRGQEYTWRLDFDLTAPVPAPPAAWGHEG